MKLKRLHVINFRAIEDLEIEFHSKITVIVGPNSIGKTTVLEAIRLCKGVLSPRILSEADQIMRSLGAIVPHQPTVIQLPAISRNVNEPIKIEIDFELSSEEIVSLREAKQAIASNLLQGRIGQQFSNPVNLINFLGTNQGKTALLEATGEVERRISDLSTSNQCTLSLTISNKQPPISGLDPITQELIAFLERVLPPSKTKFSHFPADRALPVGEFAVQLGHVDASQQLESHNSQPGLKYQRMKNVVFSSIIAGELERRKMESDFGNILGNLIKGLSFTSAGVSNVGTLAINVTDESGRQFQLDALSSGEKALLLTFLTISMTLEKGGIVLLDEPEQHLNPAVCKDIIPFIITNYANENTDIQFVICSHSPEILAGAFGAEDCGLWRIKSPRTGTEVRVQDRNEIEEALRHLGTSGTESLIYLGIVFVEGPDDIIILEAGYGELLKRYKLVDMGGRPEIEKSIERLQATEARNTGDTPRYFLFDRDNRPTTLQDSENVKIRQLQRYCIENYLIDHDVLAEMLLDRDICIPLDSITTAKRRIKELAMSQIDGRALLKTLSEFVKSPPSVSVKGFEKGSLRAVAENAYGDLQRLYNDPLKSNREEWITKFQNDFQNQQISIENDWRSRWEHLCDGKQLVDDIFNSMKSRLGRQQFKKQIMKEMKNKSTGSYRELRSIIEEMVVGTMVT